MGKKCGSGVFPTRIRTPDRRLTSYNQDLLKPKYLQSFRERHYDVCMLRIVADRDIHSRIAIQHLLELHETANCRQKEENVVIIFGILVELVGDRERPLGPNRLN